MSATGGTKSIAEESKEQRGDLSYHYFHNEKGGDAPPAVPKKLTDEEAAAMHRTTSEQLVSGASLWNTAGTWEERGCLEWVKEQLKARVVGLRENIASPATDDKFTITELKSCTGEASVVCTRGKARHGFDLELSLGWEAIIGGPTIKGVIDISEVSRDTVEDDELEFKVQIDSDSKKESEAAKDKAQAQAKVFMRKIREQLVAFDKDFRAKAERRED